MIKPKFKMGDPVIFTTVNGKKVRKGIIAYAPSLSDIGVFDNKFTPQYKIRSKWNNVWRNIPERCIQYNQAAVDLELEEGWIE